MDTNIFVLSLVAIAQCITTLEMYSDSKGINISNWITQILGNDAISYAFTVFYTLKDNKPHKLDIPKDFSPVKTHRDCGKFFLMLKNSQVKNPEVTVISFLGYVLCGMLLGKTPAIVNSGRGFILDRLFKELNLLDLKLVIHGYSSGGKDVSHDIDFTYPEIKSLVKFYSVRSGRITSLPKKSTSTLTSDTSGITDVDSLKIVDVD